MKEKETRIITQGGARGDNVYFRNYKEREIIGWLPVPPEPGDEYRQLMASGRVGRFKVVEVERVKEVDDMFIAKVEDVGYVT